jgi:hypothetical protein
VRFGEGTSKCEVIKTGAMRTYKTKQALYLVDFKILETTDKELSVGDVVNYSKSPLSDWGAREIRNFLVAAAGLIPGQVDDQPLIDNEDWAAAIRSSSNNPAQVAGSIVTVVGAKATSGAGNAYVKLAFAATSETRMKRIAASKPATAAKK